eukprot:gnl/TRDRNA2_/TRDRNA2_156185_c0_seq1.p2 gnl/TRDRNA2_/TRDRNA2_156185_c0~~gnl/TRDRNA2_/TRDRNA2_156185_c0_seq1.p2  ORF type:complete len:114 (-),score=5.90 gnl/TRDRNA2_/TRDRNA2_156185_c0_seq1:390-731(-)
MLEGTVATAVRADTALTRYTRYTRCIDDLIGEWLYVDIDLGPKNVLKWAEPKLKEHFGENYPLGRVWLPADRFNEVILDQSAGQAVGQALLESESGDYWSRSAARPRKRLPRI